MLTRSRRLSESIMCLVFNICTKARPRRICQPFRFFMQCSGKKTLQHIWTRSTHIQVQFVNVFSFHRNFCAWWAMADFVCEGFLCDLFGKLFLVNHYYSSLAFTLGVHVWCLQCKQFTVLLSSLWFVVRLFVVTSEKYVKLFYIVFS